MVYYTAKLMICLKALGTKQSEECVSQKSPRQLESSVLKSSPMIYPKNNTSLSTCLYQLTKLIGDRSLTKMFHNEPFFHLQRGSCRSRSERRQRVRHEHRRNTGSTFFSLTSDLQHQPLYWGGGERIKSIFSPMEPHHGGI